MSNPRGLSRFATPDILLNMAPIIDTNAVPGTIQLVDLEHTLRAQHADKGDIVLDPSPSSDPDDPLNWTPRRKIMAIVCSNL